ncbi:hypothetical protein BV898_19946 [Hypsibius exemplaris]|uniref:Uncharacterized protein n=1 Tax=Hypsibius exemplaris TaxID=2072580 RepID=A0A9X6NKJ3_HYPEX|nr:hypothetical protein BV898_19946 [Hypsibius exemplaris]
MLLDSTVFLFSSTFCGATNLDSNKKSFQQRVSLTSQQSLEEQSLEEQSLEELNNPIKMATIQDWIKLMEFCGRNRMTLHQMAIFITGAPENLHGFLLRMVDSIITYVERRELSNALATLALF